MASTCLVCLFITVLSVTAFGSGGDGDVPLPPENKIVGGSEVDIKDFPFMVFLTTKNNMCGGVIISERWVLTAAHCTVGRDPKSMRIRVGSNEKSSEGYEYGVEKVVNHPQYLYNMNYDISAMRISKDIKFNSTVRPVTLPKLGAAAPTVGSKVRINGWGIGDPTDNREKLKGAESSVGNFSTCTNGADVRFHLDEQLLVCLKGGDGSLCNGDSGGPVTKDRVLVGINSSKLSDKCVVEQSVLCVSVASFMQWIKDTTSIESTPKPDT